MTYSMYVISIINYTSEICKMLLVQENIDHFIIGCAHLVGQFLSCKYFLACLLLAWPRPAAASATSVFTMVRSEMTVGMFLRSEGGSTRRQPFVSQVSLWGFVDVTAMFLMTGLPQWFPHQDPKRPGLFYQLIKLLEAMGQPKNSWLPRPQRRLVFGGYPKCLQHQNGQTGPTKNISRSSVRKLQPERVKSYRTS